MFVFSLLKKGFSLYPGPLQNYHFMSLVVDGKVEYLEILFSSLNHLLITINFNKEMNGNDIVFNIQ